MNSLAARRQALAAESELYRQALAAEIQDLKNCGAQISRNLRFLGLLKPILLVAPVVASIVGIRSATKLEKRQPTGWRKWWAIALVGWRFYHRAAPVISRFVSRRGDRAGSHRRSREITP